MKLLMIIAAVAYCSVTTAQVSARAYTEPAGNGHRVLVDNDEYAPVSLFVDYQLANMKNEVAGKGPIVVPARTKKFEVDMVRPVNASKAGKMSIKSLIYLGDVTQTSYDRDHVYSLPFKSGESYRIDQGYHGSFSHKGENALDFSMKIGTEVTAVRDGRVIQVVAKHNRGCREEACKQFNNFIIVQHADGTFAEYTHIKQNSTSLKPGDEVREGQVIALSGNTGYTSGPHLHLVIYLQRKDKRETLETRFRTGDGTRIESLAENVTYTRNY